MPGTNLGTAYVQIVPSARGIKGAIQNVMGGEASAAGDSAGKTIASKIKGAIVAAGIGTALTMGLKKSLTEGAALEQSIGGIKTLFGTGEKTIEQFAAAAGKSVSQVRGEYSKLQEAETLALNNANDAYKTAGMSANNYMQTITSFAAALKASGLSGKEAAEAGDKAVIAMADNANKMGTNIEDIQNAYQGFAKQNYTMLDNLKLGYGGTKGEMERLLSDAEKLSGQEYNIDNLNDVYSAIQVIQDELGITGTTADEAAKTLSGSFASMQAAATNLMADLTLGENVGPAMAALAETASTFLFDNLMPALGNIFTSLPTAISTFIQTGLPQFMSAGTQLITSLANGAKTALPGMISNLMTGLVTMTGNLRAGFSKFVDLGLGLIKSIADGIIRNIPVFIQTVPKIVTNLAGLINDNAPKLIATGVSIIKSLVIGLLKAIPVLVANIPQIIQAIFAVFKAFQWVNLGKLAVTGISKGLKAMVGSVKKSAKEIGTKITDAIKAVPGKISGAISAIKSKLSFSGLAAKVKGVFNKVKDSIQKPIDNARTKVKSAIDKIKGLFPMSIGKIFSNISLPHISVSGGKAPFGIAGKGSLPHFSVSWHDKAMENPYLFKGATLFGAGETGDEMLYGRKALMQDISDTVDNNQSAGDIIINLNYNASDDANAIVRDIAREIRRYRMAGVI